MSTAVIALAGSPNSGKSCLFNHLTGLRQKVANYPGVTVEKKSGQATTPAGTKITFIDLPGTYSLSPVSLDERVAVDVLKGKNFADAKPDMVVAVADATNLERTLSFVLELKSLGLPIVTVLNMMDLAKRRGLKLNLQVLAQELGTPVIPTIATSKDSVRAFLQQIDRLMPKLLRQTASNPPINVPASNAGDRFEQVEKILFKAIHEPTKSDLWTQRIDRVILHPILGSIILLASLMLMFQAVFAWATPLQDGIKRGIEWLSVFVHQTLPIPLLADLLADGVIAGVGAVLVFFPQILLLFLFINLLEGSGYMARAAFILDQLMHKIGLQGRSFVPLLSSFACAIPGIMATRTIRSERDRLITILISPLMTCSARLPVYTLLVSAFIPDTEVLGPLRLQGLVMMSLFLIGIFSALVVAVVFKKFAPMGAPSPFLMELPSYKWPNYYYIFSSVLQKARAFLKRAGTTILGISILLWLLANFPKPPEHASQAAIHYSAAAKIGHFIEPVLQPIGFDWRIATGLIPGFAAREVMVSALGTVFAVENKDKDKAQMHLQEQIASTWTLATGLSLLAWYIFAPQCVSTFATIRKETNSRKWAWISFLYMLGLAYGASFVVFHIFRF